MKDGPMSPRRVSREYEAGLRFNQGIGLYDCVETNENFFIGKQWEGVQANGLPTPVFNFLKRVVLFSVANVSTDNLKLHAKPLAAGAPAGAQRQRVARGEEKQGSGASSARQGGASGADFATTREQPREAVELLTDILNDQFTAIFEFNKMGALIREFTRNAAVDGDGCMYAWWDPEMETGQDARGGIRTEVLDNTQVLFGNPNDREVQNQPYILIEKRMLVEDARRMAGKGVDRNLITADDKESGDPRLDQLGGEKVTVLTRLWRDRETGTVHAYQCTRQAELRREWDLGIKRYPLTWMSWDFVKNCYHGQAMITGLIPNQIFVNKLFAMSMISLMTLAYPKVIYDRTRVSKWSSRVGAAIGVNGNVDGVAKIMDPASISPQISQFIDIAVGYTQKFLGASDVALGDTRPDNTSAIIALQRAATPMELTKQSLLQAIEDMGRIYMDFMGAYYGQRYVEVPVPRQDGVPGQSAERVVIPFDFSALLGIPCSVELDVGASSYWSEIASMQTLDNLLTQGKISTVEYLKRLPAGQITDRETLIEALQRREMMEMQAAGMMPAEEPGLQETGPALTAADGPAPEESAVGYGQLQRKINETGEIPRER